MVSVPWFPPTLNYLSEKDDKKEKQRPGMGEGVSSSPPTHVYPNYLGRAT